VLAGLGEAAEAEEKQHSCREAALAAEFPLQKTAETSSGNH